MGKFDYSSASELFGAAIRKAFEKKRTRVITSLIMLSAAIFCIREFHSGWYMLDDTWFIYSLTVLLFSVVLLSGGVLVSNVGSFKRWKLFTGASVTAVLTCGVVTFLGVFATLICTDGNLMNCFTRVLRHTVPMLLIALALTVLVEIFFTREKRKS